METKRKYQLKRRAQRQEETRQSILDATIALQERIGVLGTTISAVAEEAGVERLTVYRHFPNETALLTAATTSYLEQNPPPDPEPWRDIFDPRDRLRVALNDVYAYHQQTEGVIGHLIQGMPYKPVVCDALEGYMHHWKRAQRILSEGWNVSDPKQIKAAIGHALSFKTWQSLIRDLGLNNAQAIELMLRMTD
jgi:AcrR family transcriptional regulator